MQYQGLIALLAAVSAAAAQPTVPDELAPIKASLANSGESVTLELHRVEGALRGVTRPKLQTAKAGCLEQVALYRRAIASQQPQPTYREEPPFDLGRDFGPPQDWKAIVTAAAEPQAEIDPNATPSQSKICFVRASLGTTQCTYFKDLFKSALAFQGLSGLSIVPLTSEPHPTNALLMKAVAWYPTGQLSETAIWNYDRRNEAFRLAVAMESPEVRIVSSGLLAGYLITADWQWEAGETRFGSNHKRRIAVYQFNARDSAMGYHKVLEYITASKYGPENDHTIDSEIGTIRKRIIRAR
ncbi:MAG TPA: hypothetical protein VGV09_18705 [Steroidobacteraceae bacterium]|nr:hypothetical protein [Steroidobacteraceae bacterium]